MSVIVYCLGGLNLFYLAVFAMCIAAGVMDKRMGLE